MKTTEEVIVTALRDFQKVERDGAWKMIEVRYQYPTTVSIYYTDGSHERLDADTMVKRVVW